jgi:hypothetical protein
MPDFESGAFNHSATLPRGQMDSPHRRTGQMDYCDKRAPAYFWLIFRACRSDAVDYKRSMRMLTLVLLVLTTPLSGADVTRVVQGLMAEENELAGVPFAEVVLAATGKKVLPLQLTNSMDRELIERISHAMNEVLRQLNASNGPAQQKRRINEVSALFEAAMKTELNSIAGFECDFPKTTTGGKQRSGYPDLRLVDKKSGRVIYLDPKLFERGSRNSTLRTFYYEPKRDTNKVLDDAHHLIVGFEHDGKADGAWTFLGWELVDLARFHVKLKAEFQASNRDLYQADAIIGRGTNTSSPKR